MPYVIPDDLVAFLMQNLGSRAISDQQWNDFKIQLAGLAPVATVTPFVGPPTA